MSFFEISSVVCIVSFSSKITFFLFVRTVSLMLESFLKCLLTLGCLYLGVSIEKSDFGGKGEF